MQRRQTLQGGYWFIPFQTRKLRLREVEQFGKVLRSSANCQLMVTAANSTPTGIPNLDAVKKLYSVQTAQLWCSCEDSAAAEQLSSAKAQLQSSAAVEQRGCEVAARWPWV